ncbi:MAG: ATP-binding protein [Alphaproteobacteria bacterium]
MIRLRLRDKILLLSTLGVILPTALFGIIAHQRTADEFQAESRHHLEYAMQVTEDEVEAVIADSGNGVALLSRLDIFQVMLAEGSFGYTPMMLKGMLDSRTIYDGLIVIDAEGVVVAATDERLIGLGANGLNAARFALAGQMFTGSANGFFDPLEIRIVSAAPIFDRADPKRAVGALIGVLNWDVVPAALDDTLNNRQEHGFGLDLVLVRPSDGRVLYATEQSAAIGEAAPSLVDAPSAQIFSRKLGDDATYLMAKGEVTIGLGANREAWVVLAGVPEDEIYAASNMLGRQFFWIGLLVACAVLMLAWHFARTLNRPISQMTEAMTRLAAGEKDVPVPVYRCRDEIGVMASSFAVFKQTALDLADAKEAADAASRAKSLFLANMSHEIRTPLNGVLGMLELLLSGALGGQQRRYAETAHRAGDHLLRILNDVLDLSKVEAGKLQFSVEDFNLRTLLDDVATSYGQLLDRRPIEVHACIGPAVPSFVRGDPHRLRQVLSNLMGNAGKFTSLGEIVLSADLVEAGAEHVVVRIAVKDTGIGITEEQRRRIFEPFAQADASTTRRYGGTGLGLAISRRLVEMMGGTLDASGAPGIGATFFFTARFQASGKLPVRGGALEAKVGAEPSRRPPAAAESTAAALPVLLVEDNPMNQQVACEMLAQLGYAAEVADDGAQAVGRFRPGKYALVLMDCQMPVMDGYEAARRIVAKDDAAVPTPIIAMTAHALPEDRERCRLEGMADHLAKPFTMAGLDRVLRRWATPPGRQPATDSAAGPAPAPCFDRNALAALRAVQTPGIAPLAERAAETFFASAPGLLSAFEQGLAAGDAVSARRAVHTLKSSSACLGLIQVAALSKALEMGCAEGALENVKSRIFELKQALEAGIRALRAELAAGHAAAPAR